jgi:hypothetical protein
MLSEGGEMMATVAEADRDIERTDDPVALERRGRRWLIWSFIFCPCHLPWSMAVLAAIFGGSAMGALISRNTIGVGIVFGLIYAIGVAIGFRHIRAAKRCEDGACRI